MRTLGTIGVIAAIALAGCGGGASGSALPALAHSAPIARQAITASLALGQQVNVPIGGSQPFTLAPTTAPCGLHASIVVSMPSWQTTTGAPGPYPIINSGNLALYGTASGTCELSVVDAHGIAQMVSVTVAAGVAPNSMCPTSEPYEIGDWFNTGNTVCTPQLVPPTPAP